MGTFYGHIIEASFFLFLAVWWALNSFKDHIKASRGGTKYVSHCSYRLPGKRFPFEAVFKLSFTIIGFSIELFSDGATFVDDKTQRFKGVNHLQHMSIYGMFAMHSSIDLMCRLGLPIPKGADWISGAMSFSWYGLCFVYHTIGHPGVSMEHIVHVLPTYVMFVLGLVFFLETVRPSWFLLQLSRIYGLLVLGTWFWHVPAMMYLPSPFPGKMQNPHYDRDDIKNVHFVVATFGFHLCLDFFAVILTYLAVYGVMRTSDPKPRNYQKVGLLEVDVLDEEEV